MASDDERARKRLVLCCDGTWNRPDKEHVTNIEKIARTVETDLRRTDGVQQLVLYLSGVGAGSYAVDRILGGAFGFGLFANVRSAYRFLALNYDPGDEIFVFGFSRGAYTARSVVGMVGRVGLLSREALVADKLGEAVERYRAGAGGVTTYADSPEEFKSKYCHAEARVTLLGVFDTVGALGVPGALGHKSQFHDVNLGTIVDCARQALALDERRLKFEPCLWEAADPARTEDERSGRVQQVWFRGVHSDVGGGYAETGLSDTTLHWMTSEATRLGLVFDQRLLDVYVASGGADIEHSSMSTMFRALNTVSSTRMALRRSGRRFVHGWRRLDPRPDKAPPERTVGVRVAATALEDYRQGTAYRRPNLVEYVEQSHDLADVAAAVLRLPEQVAELLAGPSEKSGLG